MPEKKTVERARSAARRGRSPSTQAGEFVREEIEHVREGKHGARSTKQAIAIGLSKARRAGVRLRPPRKGVSARTQIQAARDYRRGQSETRARPSPRRARASLNRLKREGRAAASPAALARQARASARKRGPAARHRAAARAIRTKGRAGLRRAARQAARTRQRRQR
jgi:hypothetical protein